MTGMAIARFPVTVIDCPDPGALARFDGAMLDWKFDVSADRASVCAEYGHCVSFHRVAITRRRSGRPRSILSRRTTA